MFLLILYSQLLSFCLSEVVSLNADNHDTVVSGGNVLVKYFSPNCGHCKALAPAYLQVALNFEKNKDKVTIAELDCVAHSSVCEKVSVRGYPTLKYYKTGEDDVDDYEGDRSVDDLSKFVATRAGIFYKPKPSRVKILTPDTFDQIAYNPDLNVFLSFTASWCGHCKKLKPELEIVANSFKDSDKVVIAYIDVDQYSDWGSKYEVHGYPTIKFFPAANKKDTVVIPEEEKQGRLFKGNYPITGYDGDRSAEKIIEYINQRSGTFRVVGGGLEINTGLDHTMVNPLNALCKALSVKEKNETQIEEAKTEALAFADHVLNEYVSSTYTRYINKVTSEQNGVAYAKTESERLENILQTGSLSDDKLFEFTVRKNILNLISSVYKEE